MSVGAEWGCRPVSELSGVTAGGARERQLHKLGIYSLRDLIYHFPRGYEDRGDVRLVSDMPDGEAHSYILTVVTAPSVTTVRRGMTLVRFRAKDDSGVCEITFFNQYYLKNSFPVGSRFRFFGKLTRERGGARMASPTFEPYTGDEMRSLVPIYPTTAGLSQKMMGSLVKKAADKTLSEVTDFLPEEIREKRGLSTLRYALSGIHFPEDGEMLERARRRLTYDEFFLFAVRIRLSRDERRQAKAKRFSRVDMTPFTDRLGYELTGAQKRAIGEIEADLCGGNEGGESDNVPMCRIVVGDVGCGKTAVAAAAAYMTAKNGMQTVLMAPTEILARQHYDDLSRLLSGVGMNVTLLVGSMGAREKRLSLAECRGAGAPRADLVIGTHALIEDKVEFSDLGLVITDEQHRFGALQRAALSEKGGEGVHTLVMSATPIPRTLSLVMYGDLDISVIDEMPKGRQTVDTFAVGESYRERLNKFIRKQVEEGHQVYIVCPAVGDGDGEEDEDGFEDGGGADLKSAVEYAKELSENVFPDIAVGFVHGKMKGAEKDAVMREFSAGKIKILVSTTVIEVGVNVPNATLMVVENAERFGLSQLHQLRGRVGRGSAKSYCVLVSDAAGTDTRAGERLLTMRREHDGFRIAERDLEQRGPGDFLPQNGVVRQSGSFGFTLARADDERGMERMKAAFEDASSLLGEDPGLEAHPVLRGLLRDAGTEGIVS